MNLYLIGLGGKAIGANIETHDMQFVIADSIEDTYEVLKDCWYGEIEKLHIDSYMQLDGIGKLKLNLTNEISSDYRKLFFVFVGTYDENAMCEVHRIQFLFARDNEEAKKSAIAEAKNMSDESFQSDMNVWHVDHVINIEEKMISVDGEKYFIDFEATQGIYNLKPEWQGYKRIDLI